LHRRFSEGEILVLLTEILEQLSRACEGFLAASR
jgi:hypothetical protein